MRSEYVGSGFLVGMGVVAASAVVVLFLVFVVVHGVVFAVVVLFKAYYVFAAEAMGLVEEGVKHVAKHTAHHVKARALCEH